MANHEQMVQSMLQELYPNGGLENLSDERKNNLTALIEVYLDPETPEARKEVILTQLQTTKTFAEILQPLNDERKQQMPKSFGKKQTEQGLMEMISSLVILCYMNNESILDMQKKQHAVLQEQQRILTSLVDLQKSSLEREQYMLKTIDEQKQIIQEQQELLQKNMKRGCK